MMYLKSSKPVVCINGSRTITDINLDLFIDPTHVGCVLTGCAIGVDTIAEWWAKRNKIEWLGFPANWKFYGKSAGVIRNHEMVDFCDILISFWDGRSKGTLETIQYAQETNVPYICHIIESLD